MSEPAGSSRPPGGQRLGRGNGRAAGQVQVPRCPVPDKSAYYGGSTWAGLIEWQTIKAPTVVQVGRDRVGQGFVPVDPAQSSLTRDEVLPGARAGCGGGRTGLCHRLGTLRTGWLASTREWAGLIGNGPTYLARDTRRPHMPMSGSCVPVYVCICLHDANVGRRSLIQSCRSYRGRACRIGRASSPRKCCALACRVSVRRGQLSRRPAPVTAADGPARQASPRVVT